MLRGSCEAYRQQSEMEYYRRVLEALEHYFRGNGWQKKFLNGGCFWLASILHQGIDGSVFMINRAEEHCALYFENGLYDIRGRISAQNFHPASEREISFMKKNYVPKFDVKKLEEYLVRKESLPLGESS